MNAYRKKKAATAVLAAVLLAGGATACEGGKDPKKDTGAASAPSASAGAAQKPADAAPAAYLRKTKQKAQEITSVRYTMTGSAAGQNISGEVSMRLRPTVAMAMTMDSPEEPGQKIDLRLLDGAMYMGSANKWLKFDLKALAPEEAKQLDSLGAAQQGQNPSDSVDSLGASKDLQKVGEETVAGQRTTHLAGTVTLDELRAASAAASTPEAKERQEKNIKGLEAQGIKSLTMDLWIDEAGQAKQVRTRGTGTSGPMDVTITFLDFNKPLEITAPPAGQVVDLAEMLKDPSEGTV